MTVINQFEKDIVFNGERLVTRLAFKEDHDLWPDNFKTCQARLINLKRKLVDQSIFKEYNEIPWLIWATYNPFPKISDG